MIPHFAWYFLAQTKIVKCFCILAPLAKGSHGILVHGKSDDQHSSDDFLEEKRGESIAERILGGRRLERSQDLGAWSVIEKPF